LDKFKKVCPKNVTLNVKIVNKSSYNCANNIVINILLSVVHISDTIGIFTAPESVI